MSARYLAKTVALMAAAFAVAVAEGLLSTEVPPQWQEACR